MQRVAILIIGCVGLAGAAAFAWVSPQLEAEGPERLVLQDLAPEFTGIEGWLNSPPLSLAALRGKVVLVDFWTYGCGNCVRTLPALKRWHERFAAQGLVVVGVHTPEFAFERDPENVRTALSRFEIPYAVALDPGFQTWSAFRNRYWPSVYLIDRNGRLVFRHEGEGDYAAIERAIQGALVAGG